MSWRSCLLKVKISTRSTRETRSGLDRTNLKKSILRQWRSTQGSKVFGRCVMLCWCRWCRWCRRIWRVPDEVQAPNA
jgi:hypothetical protein